MELLGKVGSGPKHTSLWCLGMWSGTVGYLLGPLGVGG